MFKTISKGKKNIILGVLIVVGMVGFSIGFSFFIVAMTNPSIAAVEMQENKVMENIGGELNIVSMDSYVGSEESAKIQGFFIIFSGIYEGKTQTMIRLSWQSNDGFSYLYEVPSSLFQRTVSTNDQMSVNFNLDLHLNDSKSYVYRLPAKVTPLDYNEIIKNFSKGVTVSMTDEQYAQFLKITYSNPVT